MQGAYWTASTDDLQVVADIIQFDLEIWVIAGKQLRIIGWAGNEEITWF